MGERQRPWNEFEAALLLDAFLAVQAGQITRKETVACVSRDLRRMAVNQGEEITDAYRSVKGISAQMQRMSAAYTGRMISEPAPKLYFEIVALYRSDRSKFDDILQEARQMAKEKNPVEEAFGADLASRVSPAQLSDIWNCCMDIDDFCRRTGILKQPLFETTDLKTVRKVEETVERNRAFRNGRRRQLKKYVYAAQQYVRFIREVYVPPKEPIEAKPAVEPKPVAEEPAPVVTEPAPIVETPAPAVTEPEPIMAEPEPAAEKPEPVMAEPAPVAAPPRDSSDLFTVDFDRPNGVIYTVPAELFCFGDVKAGFSNWKELYVTFVGIFCRKYPEKFAPGMCFSADGGRPDLTGIDPATMAEPRFVSGTKYFLETDFIPPQMIPKMKYILDLCGVGRDSVKITAWSRRPEAREQSETPTDQTVLSDFGGEAPAPVRVFSREAFQTWMTDEAVILESTAKNYASTVARCEDFAKSEGLSPCLLFTDDKEMAKATIAALRANRDFDERNRQMHHLLSAALSKYEQFLEDDVPDEPPEEREATAPVVEAPEPVAEAPAPVVEAPEPVAEAPAPVVEAPEPVAEAEPAEAEVFAVDFSGDTDVTFTVPEELCYGGTVKTGFSGWKELYVTFISVLCRDHPEKFHPGMSFSPGSGRADLTRVNAEAMTAPRAVPDTRYYAETQIGARAMVKKMQYLLDRCGVDRGDVRLTVRRVKGDAQPPERREAVPVRPRPIPVVRTAPEQKPVMSRRDEDYIRVLREHFDKGFRLGSAIDDRKFRKRFETVHQRELGDADGLIEKTVRRLCVVCGDRAFLPETMLPDPLREKLFRFIDQCFAEGRDTIYYQALYDAFAEDFLDTPVLNADMLKDWLFFVAAGRYSLRAKCIAKNAWTQADPKGEIRDVLRSAGAPMKVREICAALPHLPEKKIRSILQSEDEFVRNAPGEYFHESALHLDEEERETICRIIETTIAEKDFISAGELSDAIARRLPEVAENNAVFSDYGFRDALKARLGNRFAFRGNIISSAGRELSAAEIFADYARRRDSFTLDELLLLADQLGCAVPLDAVYENSLRISHDQFVARGLARFPTEETDDAIDRFCPGDYVPLRQIGNFGTFPDAGFPWNLFLLEHYAADFSPRFRLVHVGFHRDECLGAVVRRSSGIETFDELAVDVLSRSDVELKPEPVLAYLTEEGYLARRRLQSVENLILQAGARRNGKDAV